MVMVEAMGGEVPVWPPRGRSPRWSASRARCSRRAIGRARRHAGERPALRGAGNARREPDERAAANAIQSEAAAERLHDAYVSFPAGPMTADVDRGHPGAPGRACSRLSFIARLEAQDAPHTLCVVDNAVHGDGTVARG